MNPLSTPRLSLEPQVAAHAEEMFDVLSDPAIYEFENEPPRSLEWLRERYSKLETRRSSDGEQHWLNWVVRLASGEPIGYVQATVYPDGQASIAYELGSRFWGFGYASESVKALMRELVERYDVREFSAVLKEHNHRSLRLLKRLGFSLASRERRAQTETEPEELLMVRDA